MSAKPYSPGLTRTLWHLLKGHGWRLVLLLALALPVGFIEALIFALVTSAALAIGAASSVVPISIGPFDGEMALDLLLWLALGLAILRLCLRSATAYLPSKLVADLQFRLRSELTDAFVRSTWTEQKRSGAGRLQESMTNQVGRVALLAMTGIVGGVAALTFATMFVAAAIISPLISGIVLAAGSAIFFSILPVSAKTRSWSKKHSDSLVRLGMAVSDATRLSLEFKSYAQMCQQAKFVTDRAGELIKPYYRTLFLTHLATALFQGLIIALVVAGLMTLSHGAPLTLSALGAVTIILLRALTQGQQAQAAFASCQDHLPYYEALVAEIRRLRQSEEKSFDAVIPTAWDGIRTDQLAAVHDAAVRLPPVSIGIARGRITAIVGPSGSGKTTLLHILAGLEKPSSGSVLLGNTRIDTASVTWKRRVALVPQQPQLLRGSLAANVLFFREISRDDLYDALRLGGLTHFLQGAGLDRVIESDDAALSGGEIQRVALARAIAGSPDLLLLDEPTSALDPDTQATIYSALSELRARGVTIVAVTHDMRLADMADKSLNISAATRHGHGSA